MSRSLLGGREITHANVDIELNGTVAHRYGGPYLQTQQTLFQTQHSIIEAQQGYCQNTT